MLPLALERADLSGNAVRRCRVQRAGHPYIDQYFLLGEVVPEKQEGGYMAIDPDDPDDV